VSNLGAALTGRFVLTGVLADLDKGVAFARDAVQGIPPGHDYRAGALSVLGVALRTRFERTGAVADLDEAVVIGREAVDACLPGDAGRAGMLSNLCVALRSRFMQRGEVADLDEAISAGRKAVSATPASAPSRAGMLSNLGAALAQRFSHTGELGNLDEAVLIGRGAVEACLPGDPDRAGMLSNLCVALQSRFGQRGQVADLDESISAGRKALSATGAGDPSRPGILSNLAIGLLSRFDLTGVLADLDEAIATGREAVAVMPSAHVHRPATLFNLSAALGRRFDLTGVLADLEEAIATGREAVEITPPGHAYHAMALSNVSAALGRRFELTGVLTDLNEAIATGQEALKGTQPGYPLRARWQSNLAAVLTRRYERHGIADELDEVIAVGREAVKAFPPGDLGRPAALSNLAIALQTRFDQTRDPADLDEAIAVGREAVEIIPPSHPDRAMVLSNLGMAWGLRFDLSGVAADLDEAISAGRQATTAAVPGPRLARWLTAFSVALQARFDLTGAVADLDEAIAAGRQAAAIEVASPRARAAAARIWGRAAASGSRWPEAVAGYETAIGLVGLVAPRGLTRRDQEYLVEELNGLASEAAACCVHAGLAERAVELFEQGRGVLLSQALDTRTDLTSLAAEDPSLAKKFAALRDATDAAGERDGRVVMPSPETGGALDGDIEVTRHEAGRQQETAAEFEAVITEIRARPGFAGFFRPPLAGDLATAASAGPVVIVNVSRFGSHALILTSSGVLEPLPLPALTPDQVTERVISLLSAIEEHPGSASAEDELASVLGWLWDAIAGPVLDRLGHTGPPRDGEPWPRLWWCVPGLLSLLPLHAAGHHETRFDPNPRTVADRVVSSYTPTIRALIHARRERAADYEGTQGPLAPAGRLLVVAMPDTPEQPPLGGAKAEADLLQGLFSGRTVSLIGPEATRDAVTGALPAAAWVHFACHGSTDPASPSASCLLLHDYQRRPFTVTDVAALRLESAELAFLSACSTAHAGGRLADEAIHLASAFQLAGYRHVIGTLWPIADSRAVELARDLYEVLASPATGDTAAHALHTVTRQLRDRWPQLPTAWASHIHVGA